MSILNSVFAIPHRFRQTIIASTDLQRQPYFANVTFTRNEYYQTLPMKVSGDLIEFIKLHHCIVSFRGSNHIFYSKFNEAQKTAAKTVGFCIPPPFFLVLNIDTKGKTPPYFHQGMFLCALVILIHDKVDNDLKIASSSCRHVFIFVKSIKSNILVKISLTTCFFSGGLPWG